MGLPPDPRAAPDGADVLPPEQLKDAAFAGIRAITLVRVIAEIVAIGSTAALARLVAPEQFGYAAIALIPIGLAAVVGAGSIGSALVQRPRLVATELETGTAVSLLSGLAGTVLTLLAAWLLVDPLIAPEAGRLVAVAAPTFLIAAAAVPAQAVLQRELDFPKLARIEVASIPPAVVVSICVAALTDLDGEALILGPMAGRLVGTALSIAAAGMPVPRLDRAAARDLLGFGAPAAGVALVGTVTRNLDYAVLSTQVSAAQVGFYWRAFQVGVEYQRKITSILLRIAFPVFARSGDVAAIRRARHRIVRAHATIVFPLLGIGISIAPVFIPWFFGDRWEPAVEPAQILMVGGLIGTLQTGIGPVLYAVGRPGRLAALSAAYAPVLVVAVLVLAAHGISAVAIGVVCLGTGWFVLSYPLMLTPYVGIRLRDLVPEAGPALAGTCAIVAVAYPAVQLLEDTLPALALLAAVTVVGLSLYALVLRVLFPGAWSDIDEIARRSRSRDGSSSAEAAPDPV